MLNLTADIQIENPVHLTNWNVNLRKTRTVSHVLKCNEICYALKCQCFFLFCPVGNSKVLCPTDDTYISPRYYATQIIRCRDLLCKSAITGGSDVSAKIIVIARRRIFGSSRKRKQDGTQRCTMTSFIIFSLPQMLLGWKNKGAWDGQCTLYTSGDEKTKKSSNLTNDLVA